MFVFQTFQKSKTYAEFESLLAIHVKFTANCLSNMKWPFWDIVVVNFSETLVFCAGDFVYNHSSKLVTFEVGGCASHKLGT